MIAQTVARAITLVVVVVGTAIVTREVGVVTYADWATVLSVVALLSFLLDPALSPVIVRRLAQEPASVPTAAAIERVRLVLGTVAALLVVAVTVALRGTDALPLAAALGGQILPRALVLNATPWLQADQRLHRQTAWEATMAAVGLGALAIAAAAGASPEVLALAGFTVPTALLAIVMRREVRLSPSSHLPPPGAQGRRLRVVLLEVGPLAGALTLTAIYSRVYTVFVNAAEDATGVARFLFAYLFVEQILVVSGIFAAALLPLLAVRARGRDLFADGLTHELIVATAALGGVGAGALMALAPLLCRLIGGPGLAPAAYYLELLSPMALVVPVAFVLGYLHMAVGRGRRYLRINVIALAANLAGNAALTLTLGAAATARVSWGTEALVVALSYSALWRVAATARAAGLRMIVLLALVVAAAELAAGGALAPGIAGALAAAGALAVGGTQLLDFVRLVRSGPTPAGSPAG